MGAASAYGGAPRLSCLDKQVSWKRLEVPLYPQRTETYGKWVLCLLFMRRYEGATS